jgi:cytochrome c553
LKTYNPWPKFGWAGTAAIVAIAGVIGFVFLDRYQQDGPTLDIWSAICRGLGITSDNGPAAEPQPLLRTPTRIAWTSSTLSQIAAGDRKHGAFIALNCSACHGDRGLSQSGLYPTLAGLDAAVVYKQLDDFRYGKRSWGAMNAISQALSLQDSADVAVYFAAQPGGLPVQSGERAPEPGRSLREADPAKRLVFAGDPQRGIPPCSACHGPGGYKLGAPTLQRQQASYIERQLAAFAQGIRQNDIFEQMRIIAGQLTP